MKKNFPIVLLALLTVLGLAAAVQQVMADDCPFIEQNLTEDCTDGYILNDPGHSLLGCRHIFQLAIVSVILSNIRNRKDSR